ncbi:MAG TPA: hypothetical protein VI584_02195 [Nitrospiria bacterium]|nr:hypothetical protein [Nitrospiria bacterium]
MDKIEIITPEADKALPVIRDAIERQKRILSQSLARTQEKIQQLAAHLQVNPDLLLAGGVPHPENQDMDLLELEGELEILRYLQEQLESLEHLTICP